MTALGIIALLLGIVGILGAVIPGLPGPPISWIGLLLVYIDKQSDPVSTTALVVWLVIVTLITILDYVFPAYTTKAAGGHRAASVGATLGLFAGMFLTPIGMIGGSLLGAFLGEFMVEDRGVWESFRASLGAFAGFIVATVSKLIVSGILFWIILFRVF